MFQLLLGHVRDYRTTLVLVTHDNTVVARADREIRLRDGASSTKWPSSDHAYRGVGGAEFGPAA